MNFYRASVGESPSAAWRERTADSVRKYIFRKGRSKGLSFTPASPSSPWRKRRKTGTRFGVSVFWWTIKGSFSRELRARSSAALTAHCAVIHFPRAATLHCAVIHSRFPFEPLPPMAKNGHPLRGVRFFGGPSRARTLDRPVMSRLL